MTSRTPATITRRGLLGGLLAGAAGGALAAPSQVVRPLARPGAPVPSAPPAPIDARPRARPSIADLVRSARLDGQTGVAIGDPRTGRVLEGVDSAKARPPASVTKAVTALYALETLGDDYRFTTRVLGTGPVENGVVQGDLVLAGGGDPTLATDDLAAMVETLKAAGITGVTGRFAVWGGAFPGVKEIEPSQLDQLGYNPSFGGLNLNFNRVYFGWARAGEDYEITVDARSELVQPAVTVATVEVVDRRGPVYTYTEGNTVDRWTVARGALGKAGSRWLPVRFPEVYAAEVFQVLARDAGIALSRARVLTEAPEGRTLARHDSAPLVEVARGMMRYSTNLTAEALGMAATAARAGSAMELRASAASMAGWAAERAGISPRFEDHSGLSDRNAISASDMVRLLAADGVREVLRPVMRDIAMTDVRGNRIAALAGRVKAKTGTLNFVSALAGYATAENGRTYPFAIFSHDPEAREVSKASLDERPAGTAGFNGRAKRLQQDILQFWLVRNGLAR